MSNIFLITTKNNNYPEIDDKNKIYLGNWCLQNKYIADKGEKIADYHWDDRDKLEKDFEYILNLSKKLSKSIGNELNKIHKIKKNDKYWALILEYWLITFISSSFDLWENTKSQTWGWGEWDGVGGGWGGVRGWVGVGEGGGVGPGDLGGGGPGGP